MLGKMSWSALLLTSAISFGSSAYATFLPPNNLYLQDNKRDAKMTQATFNEVIDEAIAYYQPLMSSKFGSDFVVNRRWSDSTVNAYATQTLGSWEVNMFGGLARRPETTRDGFALVLCHEIGHHLGGYPFVSDWASNEGQADYFATLSCAHDLWKNQTAKNALSRDLIDAYPKSLCDDVWKTEPEQNLCYRTLLGGKSLAALLSALSGTEADWQTPDTSVVDQTFDAHPEGQCRLDTYIAGALCAQKFDATVIPGKSLGSRNNSTAAERVSGKYTCLQTSFTTGPRPLCWFKPLL
ncbi:MAG: hypothetical protein H7249_02125 [Chitinophagaceae bacterium]|nr:hypothetical protein [Oligoflexus sp.]